MLFSRCNFVAIRNLHNRCIETSKFIRHILFVWWSNLDGTYLSFYQLIELPSILAAVNRTTVLLFIVILSVFSHVIMYNLREKFNVHDLLCLCKHACYIIIWDTCVYWSILVYQARSKAEAMKPGFQLIFGNWTLFSPQTCSDDIKWAEPKHSYNTTYPLSNGSDQPAQMRRLIRVIALR